MPDAPLVLPLDAHNQRLVDNVHPAAWENPVPRRGLPPRRPRRRHRRSGGGRRRRRTRRPGRHRREAPAGRRLPQLGLRPVESGAARRARLPRPAACGRVRRRARRRTAATSRRRWSACGGCAPRSAATTPPGGCATSASTSFSARAASAGPDALEVAGAQLAFPPGAGRHRRAPRGAAISRPRRRRLPHQRDGLPAHRPAAAAGGHRRRADRLRAGAGLRPVRQPGHPAGARRAPAAARGRGLRRGRPAGPRRRRRCASSPTADSSASSGRSAARSCTSSATAISISCRWTRSWSPPAARPTSRASASRAAGVAFSPRGVEVDDRLQTTNPRIFACGDVASARRFTHVADAQARIVIQNALFGGRKKVERAARPAVHLHFARDRPRRPARGRAARAADPLRDPDGAAGGERPRTPRRRAGRPAAPALPARFRPDSRRDAGERARRRDDRRAGRGHSQHGVGLARLADVHAYPPPKMGNVAR